MKLSGNGSQIPHRRSSSPTDQIVGLNIAHVGHTRADDWYMRYSFVVGVLIASLTVSATLALTFAAPVAAGEIGEPVDYELVFPVEGKHHFSGTFWAGRGGRFHHRRLHGPGGGAGSGEPG